MDITRSICASEPLSTLKVGVSSVKAMQRCHENEDTILRLVPRAKFARSDNFCECLGVYVARYLVYVYECLSFPLGRVAGHPRSHLLQYCF
jgi:hypothetical protein